MVRPGPRAWLRRSFTLPLYGVLAVVHLALLPLTLAIALAYDGVRHRRWATARLLLFLTVYLWAEVGGIVVALLATPLVWLAPRRSVAFHFGVQRVWAGVLFDALAGLYGLHFAVTGEEVLRGGPLLFFVRHSSTADTLLPMELVARRRGYHPRYVLKRALLWDPCLDVVGHRIPNVFVRRGGDPMGDAAAVAWLGAGLGPRDMVVIYPEGTRFSETRRRDALARLERAGATEERLSRARRLTRVLPPRLGGVAALLAASPSADVVFVVHRGFEVASSMGALLGGALIGARVEVCFWRVSRAEIPEEKEAQGRWMDGEWEKVDAWLGRAS